MYGLMSCEEIKKGGMDLFRLQMLRLISLKM